jgi:hypothetical protein
MGMKFPDAGLQYLTLDGHAYMGALWFMNNERFMNMSEANRRVVLDGFYALQQATFASPKRKAIDAYDAFVEGGGDIYVPTPEEKAQFAEAAEPVQDWFRENVDGGSARVGRERRGGNRRDLRRRHGVRAHHARRKGPPPGGPFRFGTKAR